VDLVAGDEGLALVTALARSLRSSPSSVLLGPLFSAGFELLGL
jgi:hypothetical protein